jgi:hypothetical protein
VGGISRNWPEAGSAARHTENQALLTNLLSDFTGTTLSRQLTETPIREETRRKTALKTVLVESQQRRISSGGSHYTHHVLKETTLRRHHRFNLRLLPRAAQRRGGRTEGLSLAFWPYQPSRQGQIYALAPHDVV